jgi:hypothetical protein
MSRVAAMSIERTTSANSAVTYLYSVGTVETMVCALHSSQNLAFSRSPVPHDAHDTPAVIRAPPISGSRPLRQPKNRGDHQRRTALSTSTSTDSADRRLHP